MALEVIEGYDYVCIRYCTPYLGRWTVVATRNWEIHFVGTLKAIGYNDGGIRAAYWIEAVCVCGVDVVHGVGATSRVERVAICEKGDASAGFDVLCKGLCVVVS